jgi:adenylosuccinate synthase
MYEEFYGPNKDWEARILFEGAQGFYLDIDWGDYPYVTSSHCTVGSAILNGVPPKKIRRVYGVGKIYETYVGAKEFEPADPIFAEIRELGGEYGATTGRPRQCNWINIDNLRKALSINGVTHLVLNKVDILRTLRTHKAYVNNKLLTFTSEDDIKSYIEDAAIFSGVEQVLWSDNPHDISDGRERND